MKLIVISPEQADPREADAVRAMVSLGLMRYHVRKPAWGQRQLADWLQGFTPAERGRLVLHQHGELVSLFGLAGYHWRDDAAAPVKPDASRGIRSRACHDLLSARAALGIYDTILLSPLFPSLSKPGYGRTREWSDADLEAFLQLPASITPRTDVFALGGIAVESVETCAQFGFDGVAALGSIWNAADPISAFASLRDACRSAAAGGNPVEASLRVPLIEPSVSVS